MSSSEAPKTWLSQDAYDRLQAELDELIAARPAIAAEINARREEGDLRENGGYHAAREEQGKQEGRIRYLQGVPAHRRGRRGADGRRGRARHRSSRSTSTTTRATPRRSCSARGRSPSTTDLTVYSPESALGKAILGASAGQTVTYTAPSGADIKVTVVKFEPFAG